MRMGITLESLTILRGILMKRVTRSLEPVGHFILMKVCTCTLTLYPYEGMYTDSLSLQKYVHWLSIHIKVRALASDVWPQKHSAIEKCINWQKYWFVGYWLSCRYWRKLICSIWWRSLFSAGNEGSVAMGEGEEMFVLEQDQGDGWTRVRKHDNSEGFVPTSYIQCHFYDQDEV